RPSRDPPLPTTVRQVRGAVSALERLLVLSAFQTELSAETRPGGWDQRRALVARQPPRLNPAPMNERPTVYANVPIGRDRSSLRRVELGPDLRLRAVLPSPLVSEPLDDGQSSPLLIPMSVWDVTEPNAPVDHFHPDAAGAHLQPQHERLPFLQPGML